MNTTTTTTTTTSKFQLHYRKHKYTPDSIESALLYDIQNYIPIYSRFFDINELPGRDMSKIAHPFIVESLEALNDVRGKSGVYFIHLNHTNPALNKNSNATRTIMQKGFNVASRNQIFHL